MHLHTINAFYLFVIVFTFFTRILHYFLINALYFFFCKVGTYLLHRLIQIVVCVITVGAISIANVLYILPIALRRGWPQGSAQAHGMQDPRARSCVADPHATTYCI